MTQWIKVTRGTKIDQNRTPVAKIDPNISEFIWCAMISFIGTRNTASKLFISWVCFISWLQLNISTCVIKMAVVHLLWQMLKYTYTELISSKHLIMVD